MNFGEYRICVGQWIRSNLLKIVAFSLLSSISTAQNLDEKQVQELKKIVFENTRVKSNQLPQTGFNGSFDWHSDVHGHWALLSMARVTHDSDLEDQMMKILSFSRLKMEIQFLTAHENKSFELPYGRAWFLMLLRELSLRPLGGDPQFQKYRAFMISRMIDYLKSASFPEIEWLGHFSGQHDSWLMSLFLTQLAIQDLPEFAPILQSLIETKMSPQSKKYLSQPKTNGDFISLSAMNSLLTATPPMNLDLPSLPKKNKFSCHDPGYLQTATWPLSQDCARGSAKSCELTKSFAQAFFAKSYLWKDNFDCVSHWVPQFMWMSHWLSLGSP